MKVLIPKREAREALKALGAILLLFIVVVGISVLAGLYPVVFFSILLAVIVWIAASAFFGRGGVR